MKAIRTLAAVPQEVKTAVAMGFFDGVHRGHQAVIRHACRYAGEHGLTPAVFTFRLPADSTMKGKRLQTRPQKYGMMEAMGVEYYLCPGFEEICGFTPEQFVQEMLCGLYHAKAVFCGENFTFGCRAAGNVETLKRLCAPLGIEVIIVPMTLYEGEAISSSRIRAALQQGEVEKAGDMLGHPYRILLPVTHGQRLGRTLGTPTINQIYPEGFQLPHSGVYVSRVCVEGKWYPSVTGLGTRPTVNTNPESVTCETFIPDFSGEIYGEEVLLEFVHYLEPSHKFENVQQLRDAVMAWAAAALEYENKAEPEAAE